MPLLLFLTLGWVQFGMYLLCVWNYFTFVDGRLDCWSLPNSQWVCLINLRPLFGSKYTRYSAAQPAITYSNNCGKILKLYPSIEWGFTFYLACVIIRRLPKPSVENVTAQGFEHTACFISFLPLEVSPWAPLSQLYVSSCPPLLSEHLSSLSAACRPSGFCGSSCGLCVLFHLGRHRLPLHSVEMNIKFSPLIFSP